MARVAITMRADGDGLSAVMDTRFGRAPRFLVADDGTGEVLATLDNTSIGATHGAGTSAAARMRSEGIQAVISVRFGPKALEVLRAAGIEAWTAPSGLTTGEALERHRAGRLEPAPG